MVYGLLYSQVGARAYDAFGDIGSIFQELEWKTPIFSGRVAPKTPNAFVLAKTVARGEWQCKCGPA